MINALENETAGYFKFFFFFGNTNATSKCVSMNDFDKNRVFKPLFLSSH